MTNSAVVTLADAGKRYTKYEDVPTLLTGARHLLKRGRRGQLWAVRHLDLEVKRGEAVGVIGHNGSGKSTTLAMMAGVTAPTEGRVRVAGRLAPLLRLGVGFEQELTGRENVFMNGMILGMTTKEIEQRFDDVVAFAEMEEFIDTPVKFYSSGMLVRLGFASAVSSRPDLLIVDEVLAVGDVAFQARSFDRMMELRQEGATLVVVSHNMQAIRRLTDRVVVLHKGEVSFQGPTSEGISVYHDLLRYWVNTADARPSDKVSVQSFELYGEDGEPTANVGTGERVTFRARTRFDETVEEAVFGVAIATDSGQFVYAESSYDIGARTFRADEEHTLTITLSMPLNSGSYTATGGVHFGRVAKEQVNGPPKVFYVSGRPLVRGIVDLGASFGIES
jgi:ABC-type polysaccharide/polyol phosphate transport system ATPase subunit